MVAVTDSLLQEQSSGAWALLYSVGRLSWDKSWGMPCGWRMTHCLVKSSDPQQDNRWAEHSAVLWGQLWLTSPVLGWGAGGGGGGGADPPLPGAVTGPFLMAGSQSRSRSTACLSQLLNYC